MHSLLLFMHVFWGLSEIDPGEVPVSTVGEEINWLFSAPWGKIFMYGIAAVAVIFLGNLVSNRKSRATSGRMAKLDFDIEIARLESLPVQPIGAAKTGKVHFEAIILSATGTLGSKHGKPRIWHNRAGSGRNTAVGVELAVLGDATGQVGVENLETARVIAPRDSSSPHDTVSLYVGDRVQALGIFTADAHGDDPDPSKNIYGMIGSNSQLQLRVLRRHGADQIRPDSAAVTSPQGTETEQ